VPAKSATDWNRRSGRILRTAAGRCISAIASLPTPWSDIGWQLTLPDLDASAYDHLELWIRGDARVGYADALKLEFKQPLADAPPGLLREGSTVIDRYHRPLAAFPGPLESDERHRRLAPSAPIHPGAATAPLASCRRYWLDDIALIKTGQPGPSIHDPVIPPNKTAWENRLGGKEAAQPYIQARLAGWPERGCWWTRWNYRPTTGRSWSGWRAIPGAGWRP
jgi:hypothetical protein